MAQRTKPKPKSKGRVSSSNKGANNLLEDTLARLSSIAKDAESTLTKVRAAVKDAAHNVGDGAGDLASHLPIVGHDKPKARKSAKKKSPAKKSPAAAKASAEKKSPASSKKADSAPKAAGKKKSSDSAPKASAAKKSAAKSTTTTN